MEDIPADFCRSLAGGSSKFTAEAWCFWFVYMAPGLLKGRFPGVVATFVTLLLRLGMRNFVTLMENQESSSF
jgi:hypothetical protein